jgi:hypothetical protein
MKRSALLLPLLLLLVACGPVLEPVETATPSGKPTVEVTPTTEADSGPANPDDYLIAGGLNEDPDGDGFWSARYAFFTDDSHAVRCDIWIFSGDSPAVLCGITPGNESLVTYELPAGAQCDLSTSNPYDGYSLSVGGKSLDGFAGWSGCPETRDYNPEDNAITKVLPEGQVLTTPPFTCVVGGKAASCDFTDGSGGITLGLYTAAHYG